MKYINVNLAKFSKTLLFLALSFLSSPLVSSKEAEKEKMAEKVGADEKSEWLQLFNGKDLTGWVPKFKGFELGVNYKDVFKVKDGVLVVDYSDYGDWDGKFGHLFYKKEFSHYILRAEYRFVGEQVPNGPKWALRNNGFMIHGQSAESMKKEQDFPNSIEVQLLGGPRKDGTPKKNLNICTPGTNVVKDGKLITKHVIESEGPINNGDDWYTVEIEVRGSDVIRHKQNGKTVIEYSKPQLDDGTLLEKGTISIQAESHCAEFRKIEIKELKK